MNPPEEDTIAAIATPPGMGGIGIVRLSGPRSGEILARIFRRRGGTGPLLSHRFYLGEILRPRDQNVLDEVLVVFMGKPKTYTREDVVEIQAHSGTLVLREILELVLQSGARPAEPGEFTRRAFLNGRIDLTQAEAVMDLIQAKTRHSLELANLQRRGRLAEKLEPIREDLLNLTALLEAGIDFPEEEIPEVSRGEVALRLERAENKLVFLLRTYEEGKIYREGISAAIVGRPNVGKSSLLNSLLREDRAIVTPVPGTTRDVIEELVNIRGIPVKMMDTAGLHSAKDAIEREGIRRTQDRLARVDLVIWVVDGSGPLTSDDLDILSQVGSKKTVIAVNKMDLPRAFSPRDLAEFVPQFPQIQISALHQTNIDLLEDAIRGQVLNGGMEPNHEFLLTNLRHKQAVEKAQEALVQARQSWEANLPPEFITLDLARSLQFLGEIVGETSTEDLLNRIFGHFCIGK